MRAHAVIMGVSGCGKTSVGEGLAASCGVIFIDGDDLHPKSNIEKMSRGEPLDDNDRAPWLAAVGQALAESAGPAAIGCSALKRAYRDIIRRSVPDAAFVHLHAAKPVLARRVAERKGHFMPPGLLDSQFAALEMLGEDEIGRVVDIDRPFEAVLADAWAFIMENGQ